MQPSSERLEQARAGEPKAIAELLEQHQAQIYRFGLKMCRNADDAAEVLQETMLAVARGVGDFRGESSLSTWMYTIARSHCIKKRRKELGARAHSADAAELDEMIDPKPSPEEIFGQRETQRVLEQALHKLPPEHREVLILRDIEGLRAAEVASVVGISVQAVKSRLHRARLALREEVAPRLGLDAPEAPSAGACPDVLALFSQHLEDEISASVCSEMQTHLETCARCRGACDSLKHTLALCRTTSEHVTVPEPVQDSVRTALRNFVREHSASV